METSQSALRHTTYVRRIVYSSVQHRHARIGCYYNDLSLLVAAAHLGICRRRRRRLLVRFERSGRLESKSTTSFLSLLIFLLLVLDLLKSLCMCMCFF